MTRGRKVTLMIIGAVVLICLLLGLKYYMMYQEYMAKIDTIKIEEIDLSTIRDGLYSGVCNAGMVSAIVEVTVEKGEIVNLKLVKHNHGEGEKAETIIDSVMGKQSLMVDVVSGATSSSKVILEAVSDALRKGRW